MIPVRRLTIDDLLRLRQFWIEHWGSDKIVSRGRIYHPEQLEGFVLEDNNQWVGLLTFLLRNMNAKLRRLIVCVKVRELVQYFKEAQSKKPTNEIANVFFSSQPMTI